MVNDYFGNYDKKYPYLILDIIDFFDFDNKYRPVLEKTVLEFCSKAQKESNQTIIYDPIYIDRICKKMCDNNMLECIKNSVNAMLNVYMRSNSIKITKQDDRELLMKAFNSIVYGFQYIYSLYKDSVVPLICKTNDVPPSTTMGTGFKYRGGIVTAKHCIEDVQSMCIKGYNARDLNNKKIYIFDNRLDIAYIETNDSSNNIVYFEDGEIMEEVLVLGYPRIPTFVDFLTAEKALISSKGIVATKGNIAAFGKQYMSGIEAMLITAKIRGGNSGGPVINSKGSVVGVACQKPDCSSINGNYDDLGYGIAIPIEYVDNIINERNNVLSVKEDFFIDEQI